MRKGKGMVLLGALLVISITTMIFVIWVGDIVTVGRSSKNMREMISYKIQAENMHQLIINNMNTEDGENQESIRQKTIVNKESQWCANNLNLEPIFSNCKSLAIITYDGCGYCESIESELSCEKYTILSTVKSETAEYSHISNREVETNICPQ
jgi:hypothetical protein